MTFEEQFPKITQEDFERTAEIARRIRPMIKGLQEESGGAHEDPSFIWELIRLYAYAFYPTYDLVNVWRFHTEIFTGNNLIPFAEAHYHALPKKLLKRYRFRTAGLPEDLIARPPRICGECGWEINGGVVNDDVLMYQRHLATLHFHGIVERLKKMEHPVILEIGGGYGALAYFLKKTLPHARYYVVDLTESLLFAAIYLQVTMPQYMSAASVYDGARPDVLAEAGNGITFVPASSLGDIPAGIRFDLVINTGSFGEMTVDQIAGYRDFAAARFSPSAVLYEENQDTTVPVTRTLREKLACRYAEGQQRFWANDEAVLRELDRAAAGVMSGYPLSFRIRRKTFEFSSRTIRKFPRLKRIVKRMIGSY